VLRATRFSILTKLKPRDAGLNQPGPCRWSLASSSEMARRLCRNGQRLQTPEAIYWSLVAVPNFDRDDVRSGSRADYQPRSVSGLLY
jgi:hypothetical protein